MTGQPQRDRFGREYDPERQPGPRGYTIEVWCFECRSYVDQVGVPPAEPDLQCEHAFPDAIDPSEHEVDRRTLLTQQLRALRDELPVWERGWKEDAIKRLIREKAEELAQYLGGEGQ